MKLYWKKIFIMFFCLVALFLVTYICTTILCKDITITKQEDYRYSSKSQLDTEIKLSGIIFKYKYNPNKYVIGIHGDAVAVFKTDKHGNFVLESPKDISKVKLSKITEGDIELLKIGDSVYEYDTKENAKEALKALFVS